MSALAPTTKTRNLGIFLTLAILPAICGMANKHVSQLQSRSIVLHFGSATRKMRYLRFKLRTLFCVVVLVGILLGWFAAVSRRKQQERESVELLRQIGAAVYYDYQLDNRFVPFRSHKEPPGPKPLRDLLGDDWFATVTCVHAGISSELTHTEFANRLRDGDQPIFLKDVGKIKDEDLSVVINCISRFPNLKRLHLEFTAIADDVIVPVEEETSLKYLYLPISVSDAALSQIRKALPNCEVIRTGGKSSDTRVEEFDERMKSIPDALRS